MVLDDDGRPRAVPAADRGVLPRRVVRAVRAVPGRHRAPGGGAAPPGRARSRPRPATWRCFADVGARDAGRVDLRSRSDRGERRRVGHRPPGGVLVSSSTGGAAAAGCVELTIDGATVRAPEGATLLDACRGQGVDIPTLCYGDTLTPEERLPGVHGRGRGLPGARAGLLAPGRGGHGGAHRHRAGPPRPPAGARAPRLVGRPVDHPRRRRLERAVRRRADRFGPRRAGRGRERDASGREPTSRRRVAATVAQPAKVDNDLYVRDYAKCILCYKCVDACGEQWQNTFAIPSPGGASTPASPPSTTCRCPSRPACTAATASRCAPPAR